MDEIIVLTLEFEYNGIKDSIFPVILKDDQHMVLIDCGYQEFLPLLEEAFKKYNLQCSDLTHIVITHHDYDHMGSLYQLKKKYPHIMVVSSKKEEPYISGKKKAFRLDQAEIMQKTLPLEQKESGEYFCQMLRGIETQDVDIVVSNGDFFEWCGGCEIIETVGHTIGHISLYLYKYKTLIAGDAATIEGELLVIANPQFAWDIEQSVHSLEKINTLQADTIICYHGGIFKSKLS